MRISLSVTWRAISSESSKERRVLAEAASVERKTDLCFNLLGNFVASPFEDVTVPRFKRGELRGGEYLIKGNGGARQVAGRVDLVSEEILKLAVGGRYLHDVGHFGSQQLEFETGGVKRVHLKEFFEKWREHSESLAAGWSISN